MSLYIDAGFDSINKNGEELCGDKVEMLRDGNSVIVVLADGLGSGVKANILSTLTSKIIGTILANGLGIDEAVETIANTLPVCLERNIAYSTFTILQIFDYGEGYLAEFDNPSVFRFRKGKPMPIETDSRVICGKTIREARFEVLQDDLFVMVSDGAVHAGIGHTMNFGWQWENVNEYIQRTCRGDMPSIGIAKLLLSACDSLYAHEPGDDTTVAAIKAKKLLNVNIMVGPPADARMDKNVVDSFYSAEGKKVVCGGTTSQIVARELRKEIITNFEYYNPGIPPTAEIEGIDLTTEGVLTLRKALNIMQNCISSGSTMKDFLMLGKKDGASRLARFLIEEGTNVNFFVGRAINPAHQDPDFPLNLEQKIKLVEDMAECIRSIGKQASIRYN
ncbi:MAG TPA: SpoIIE family protein phosphatase [Clostridia bacterium]|nr:SpoIIE family protein phosphatase [Clostridia bacterium]